MNNLVKVVQASGKAILLPAPDIVVIREVEPGEAEKLPAAKCGLWIRLNGSVQHTYVRERYGFLLRLAGGASSERVELRGMAGTRLSMPRALFANAIEGNRTRDPAGNPVAEEDATLVNTSIPGVNFHVMDSVEDILDLMGADVSDDDGQDEVEQQPAEEKVSAKPKPGEVGRRRPTRVKIAGKGA